MASHDSETPAHGQQVIVACAFLHHDFDGVAKVFMPKRAKTKKFLPDIFELPGGHIDFGEDIVEGLKREVREELGMEIVVGDTVGAFTFMNDIKGAHCLEVVYFARFVGDISDIKLDPADHSEAHWFSADQEKEFGIGMEPDDPELLVIRRGFELLRGEKLVVGSQIG